MKPIVVITHVDRGRGVIGLVGEAAEERSLPYRVVRPFRGDELPEPGQVGAVVVMGGPQAAYDDSDYLRTEEHFLSAAVEADVPVLGICLGAQLLARALGGSGHPGPDGLEAGIIQVKPADSASTEVIGEYFSFHSDSMTPPEDAEILATSDRYVQAWRTGSATAYQFHPEITLEGVQALLDAEGPKLQRFGVDVPAMRAEAERYFTDGAQDARSLLASWFDALPHERPRR